MEPSNHILQYATPQPRSNLQSLWGIASTICLEIAFLLMAALCLLPRWIRAGLLDNFGTPLILLLLSIGTITAIWGIIQRTRSRKLAIIGLLNAVWLASILLFSKL